MGTYSSSVLTGIKLTNASQNPVEIEAGVIIGDNGTSVAILGTSTLAFDVTNFGTVQTSRFPNGERGSGKGIFLQGGGSVTNASTGVIDTGADGVNIFKTGTVVNLGTIRGLSDVGGNYGIAFGFGNGVVVSIGTITNGTSTGSSALIEGNGNGVSVGSSTGAAVVKNSGSIVVDANLYRPGYYGSGFAMGNGIHAVYNTTVFNYLGAHIVGRKTGIFGALSVFNSGTITASPTGAVLGGGTGVEFNIGGYASNSGAGLISGVHYGVLAVNASATITNFGIIEATGTNGVGVSLNVSGSTVTNAGTISGAGGAVVFSALYNGNNRLIVDPGAVFLGTVTAAGNTAMELASAASAGTVTGLGSEYTNFTALSFDIGAKWTAEGSASGFPGTITGFAAGDTIDVDGFVAVSRNYNGSGLVLTDALSNTETIGIQGSFATSDFTILPDTKGGTDITTTACYCRGTLILTDRGEVAVEDLAIGDRLVTRDGTAKRLKWIGRRSYVGWLAAGNPKVLPVCFKPGSLADSVPRRDLWVSPEHAMYLDGMLVPAELLVNRSSILKAPSVDAVEYFHLELDEHDVILAEGAWSESFVDDDSRDMFHNATEYWALYPEAPLQPPARYCAPRVEEGFELEALRHRLLGRARRLRSDGTAATAAALEGHLDLVRNDRIEGWARDPAVPETPVALMVLANGAEIGRVMANRYRPDLAEAGVGDGCHGFELVVPGGLAASWQHTIEVCHAADGTMLSGSPVVLQPTADGLRGEVLDNFAA